MNRGLRAQIHGLLESVPYFPSVSIIERFEAKLGLKKELIHSLKLTADKAKRKLKEY